MGTKSVWINILKFEKFMEYIQSKKIWTSKKSVLIMKVFENINASFTPLGWFIYFSQKFSVLWGTEISVVGLSTEISVPHSTEKFLWKVDESTFCAISLVFCEKILTLKFRPLIWKFLVKGQVISEWNLGVLKIWQVSDLAPKE